MVVSAASNVVPSAPNGSEVAAPRAVFDSVGDESHRFNRRMGRQQLVATAAEAIDPVVLPYIGAIAPMPAEFHVVDVVGGAAFENKDEIRAGIDKVIPCRRCS